MDMFAEQECDPRLKEMLLDAQVKLCCQIADVQATQHGTIALDGKNTEAWILTHSGRVFAFEEPDPSNIVIEDIAHALSLICRWTGHVRCHYSVAEHCLRVSWLVENKYGRSFAREGLLHDAAEAYVSDLNGPLKRLIEGEYRKYEDLAQTIIGDKFNTPTKKTPEVKDCDGVLIVTEGRDLFSCPKSAITKYYTQQPLPDPIIPMSAELARLLFLHRFEEVKSW